MSLTSNDISNLAMISQATMKSPEQRRLEKERDDLEAEARQLNDELAAQRAAQLATYSDLELLIEISRRKELIGVKANQGAVG